MKRATIEEVPYESTIKNHNYQMMEKNQLYRNESNKT